MSGYPARAHDSQGPLAGLVGTGSMLRLAVRQMHGDAESV